MDTATKCVLLIDDDADDNYLHEMVIRDFGNDFEVISHESAEGGLEYLAHVGEEGYPKPDLVFLDINMPRMDGFDFLCKYKELPEQTRKNTKVVMLSTSSHPHDQEKAEEIYERVYYKTKPLTEELLEELI